MSKPKYKQSRPSIPAEVRRAVLVESGHSCAIKGCLEHTYLEIHHIDENRENNSLVNLILLCDKHHKMAHRGIIDRKALQEYKRLLHDSHDSKIVEALSELKELVKGQKDGKPPESELADTQPVDDKVTKLAPSRPVLLNFILYHATVKHYENENQLFFEHQVEYTRGGKSSLTLDALRQDDDLEEDIIIEVQYIRKLYMDSAVYGSWVEKKIELYELFTGRQARGILLVVVGKESMKSREKLSMTIEGVNSCVRNVSLEIYSCNDIGFDPGPLTGALLQSNLHEDG